MDKGLTLASMLNDVPISRWDAGAGSDWRPKNSPPQYAGPIRLRQGLGQSKNVVMVRAMRAMGVDYAAEYLQRFGFPAQNIVHTESLALGSASFTPLQVARGYSVMANGGFLVNPFFISKIENDQGGVLFEERPKIACPQCDLPVIYGDTPKSNVLENKDVEDVATSAEPQNGNVPPQPQPQLEQANQSLVAQSGAQEYAPHVINTPLSFLIKSALNSNIFGEPGWMGTGWRAGRDLQRHDIGGKTGTTNNNVDTWFAGIDGSQVTITWVGRDNNQPTKLYGASGAMSIYQRYLANQTPTPLNLVPPEDIADMGVDYDGNFVCSGGMRVLPVWTSDPQSLCQQSEMQQHPSGNPFDQSSQPQQQPQQQPAQQEQKDSDGVAGWIKDMFGSN